MTTLVLTMGDQRIEALVPKLAIANEGGGEHVFAPAKAEAQINGDRELELAAEWFGLELVEPK